MTIQLKRIASHDQRGRTTQLPPNGLLVVPSDSPEDDFSEPVPIEIHTAGTFQLIPFSQEGTPVAIPHVVPEEWLPYRPLFEIRRVLETGTTADMIIVGGTG